MKNSLICTKCESPNVLKIEGQRMNQATQIPLNKWSTKNAKVNRFICTDCGFTEEYVELDYSFRKYADAKLREQDKKDDGFV